MRHRSQVVPQRPGLQREGKADKPGGGGALPQGALWGALGSGRILAWTWAPAGERERECWENLSVAGSCGPGQSTGETGSRGSPGTGLPDPTGETAPHT